jgi:hypothetical protein
MRSWVKDINDNILLPDSTTGRLTPWTSLPPWKDPPYENAPNHVHQQYRLNLNENTLMNFFRNHQDPANPDRLTFNRYYNERIEFVLNFFVSTIDLMIKDDWDTENKTAFSNAQWDRARVLLEEAARIPGANGLPDLQMKEMYLDTFHDPANMAVLQLVWDKIKEFQEHMRWICVPFLKFPKTLDPSRPRPVQADLDIHLDGGTITDVFGNQRVIMAYGDFDYHDMLFHCHMSQDEACQHRNARIFAHCKGFFDKERVTDRVRRELQGCDAPLPPPGGCFDSGWRCGEHEHRMMGGGNGYECRIIGGVRQCIVDQPVDYCVNNGSQFCP